MAPLRTVFLLAGSALGLVGMQGRVAAQPPAPDATQAFVSVFGREPPVRRAFDRPQVTIDTHQVVGQDHLEMDLYPERLVRIDDTIWALVVREEDVDRAHSHQGAVSVIYLKTQDKGFSVLNSWYELAYSGSFGVAPKDKDVAVHDFGAGKLLTISGEWCGMGGCSGALSVIGLYSSAPRWLGETYGSAWYGPDITSAGCETYRYTATVVAPHSKADLLAIRYAGWRAPEHKSEPKSHFSQTVDTRAVNGDLKPREPARFPNCGR